MIKQLSLCLLLSGIAYPALLAAESTSSAPGSTELSQIKQAKQGKTIAKVLWSEFDGKGHALLTANYDGENWSAPFALHDSENPMTSVAVGSADNETELLVWTEQIKEESQLFHKWFYRKTATWSEAKLLSDFGTENIGAAIVVDPNRRLHLFWSANKTDFSDIVHMSYANNEWSKTEIIHQENDVPDIQPNASLDVNGNIVVTWSSYSFDAGQYVELQKLIETDQPNGKNAQKLVDTVDFEDITLPNFLPTESTATLYFPDNVITQSSALNP